MEERIGANQCAMAIRQRRGSVNACHSTIVVTDSGLAFAYRFQLGDELPIRLPSTGQKLLLIERHLAFDNYGDTLPFTLIITTAMLM